MSLLWSLFTKLGKLLALYGGWGLFAISFLDSSFVAFPLVNDLLLIHLASQHPERMPLYAIQATAGSILGSYVLYAIGRSGAQFAFRRSSPRWKSRAEHWLTRNDFVAVLFASLLPPPMPFKVFLLTAGALRVNAARFGAALVVGRGLRFGIEGFLGARYGVAAEAYIKDNAGWVSLVAAVAVVAATLIWRRLARRSAPGPNTGGAPSSDSR